MRMPWWIAILGALVLGSLFWPFLLLFAGMVLIVGVVGALTNRRPK